MYTASFEKRANILQIEQEKYSLSASMLKQWLDAGIDALLMPVIPWVGYEPNDWVKSSQWVGYTGMWNLLNYASVTVPVGKADRALDAVGGGKNVEWEGHEARNKSDAFNQSQCRFQMTILLDFVLIRLLQMILSLYMACPSAYKLWVGDSARRRLLLLRRWWMS